MRHRTVPTLVLLAPLLLSACTGAGGPPGATPSADPPDTGAQRGLEGRTFLATAAIGQVLVPGSTVRLSFEDGNVGASGGCNSMGGPYVLDGSRLAIGQLAMTEMACEPGLMAQDQWLAELLDGPRVSLAGDTLTLAKGGVRLALVDREVADPDRPLEGTRWVVDGLVSADAVSSVPSGVTASLTFVEGRVEVEAGCNRGGGAVMVTDATLTFGPIGLTKMACENGAMEVERAVMAALSGEVRYTIEAATLALDAGPAGLTLRTDE